VLAVSDRLTRRYHVPSALRRTPARIELPRALALIDEGALLLDVRRHDDRTEQLEGARRIWPDEIPALVATLPRDTPIVLACT
jgi:rhodanese-related sulfurtransferase